MNNNLKIQVTCVILVNVFLVSQSDSLIQLCYDRMCNVLHCIYYLNLYLV